MPDYNTQVHASLVSDHKSLKKRHWMLAFWSLMVWFIVSVAYLLTYSSGLAVTFALVGLGTVFGVAWLLRIPGTSLRRNLYGFSYFCLTAALGTSLWLLAIVDISKPLMLLLFGVTLASIPVFPAIALQSFLPLFIPFIGLFSWFIARYLLDPAPITPTPAPAQSKAETADA